MKGIDTFLIFKFFQKMNKILFNNVKNKIETKNKVKGFKRDFRIFS